MPQIDNLVYLCSPFSAGNLVVFCVADQSSEALIERTARNLRIKYCSYTQRVI